MSYLIPNNGPVGRDVCDSPQELEVPLVIVDNGKDCFWYHDAMDTAVAERMAFVLMHGTDCEAYRVNVRLILPAASDVRTAASELASLHSDQHRVQLRVG